MPKSAIKSYEDWDLPKFLRGDVEDIDMERVKLEFYTRESENAQYRASNRSLKSQVADLRSQITDDVDDDSDDDTDDSAPRQKSKEKSKTEGEGQGPSLNEIRLELALEKGLTKNQVMRLRGENREELEADATAYMEEHGITQGSDDEDDKDGQEPTEKSGPPQRQPRRGDGKSGTERDKDNEPTFFDPEKLSDLV